MAGRWTVDEVTSVTRGYQQACVLFAAAELNIFSQLVERPLTALELAGQVGSDPRATTVLLDALAALELLEKRGERYYVPPVVADLLAESGSHNVLPMVRHQAACLRRWAQLPEVVKTGQTAQRRPGIRGEVAELAAFIGAMDYFSAPVADEIVRQLGPPSFRHLLDIGGASGTWTIAFLRAVPEAKATLFDLPEVIEMARERIAKAGLAGRVTLVAGDFYADELPAGADFTWLSAIAHQNSRQQNRALFRKIYSALERNGLLVLRDVVMDNSRTSPQAGAMFAVNMLVATQGGGTYTFEEFKEDLVDAGFSQVSLIRKDEFMNSLIRAIKV